MSPLPVEPAATWGLDQQATAKERVPTYTLIDRKLRGQDRLDARNFVKGNWRTVGDLRRLTERLESLPDLDLPAHPRAKLSDQRVADMIRERFAGASLRELAEKYDLAVGSVSRICTGSTRTDVYQQVIRERNA